MRQKQMRFLATVFALPLMLLGAKTAFACSYPPPYPTLVPNIIAGIQNGSGVPTPNDTVCVDIKNNFIQGNKIVWDMDTPVTDNGLPNTTPAGIRHMWMMGLANLGFAKKWDANHPGQPSILPTMHIYGVIHGTAIDWALSNTWWESQLDKDGNQLYPNGNPMQGWFKKIAALRAKGLDIHLEACGVTLMGAGLTSADVYPGILVNQGAFGRFEDLHQQGYLVIQEGWVDNDSMYIKKPDEARSPMGQSDGDE